MQSITKPRKRAIKLPTIVQTEVPKPNVNDIEVEFDDEKKASSTSASPPMISRADNIDPEHNSQNEDEVIFTDQMLLNGHHVNVGENITENVEEKIENTTENVAENIVEDHNEIDEDSDVEPPKPKKSKKIKQVGPGRPRKTPKKEPIPKRGIAPAAQHADNVMEFMYDKPLLMKKIVAFFKSIAAVNIQLLFRPTQLVMYAIDHHGKSHVRVVIDGSKLNHYYCKTTYDIGVAQKDLEMIVNVIDKDYTSMVMCITKDNLQKSLTIVLEHTLEINENQTIDLVGLYNHMTNEDSFINESYTIYWKWTSKYFKKIINDIKTMSETFAITQSSCEQPLIIMHNSENKKIHKNYVIRNSNKVDLKSKIMGDDSLRIDIKVEYIKPISSAHIADGIAEDITIYIDETKPLMTKAFIDGGVIEIKTLTDIIDDRPDM